MPTFVGLMARAMPSDESLRHFCCACWCRCCSRWRPAATCRSRSWAIRAPPPGRWPNLRLHGLPSPRQPTRCCPTTRAGSWPLRSRPVCRRRKCRRLTIRCARLTGGWITAAGQHGSTVVPVFSVLDPLVRTKARRKARQCRHSPGRMRLRHTATGRRRCRAEGRQPARRHPDRDAARRSEEPVQPPCQGGGRDGHRCARRRRSVADQTDEDPSRRAWTRSQDTADGADFIVRVLSAWCR